MEQIISLDLDGTTRLARNREGIIQDVPDELIQLVGRLKEEGRLLPIVPFTGSPSSSMHMAESQLRIEFMMACVSFGAELIERDANGVRNIRVSPVEEQTALAGLIPSLKKIQQEHSGVLICDGAAHDVVYPEDTFREALEATRRAISTHETWLRIMANPADGGIVIVPRSTSKETLARRIIDNGYRFAIAAGDTETDAYSLEASDFPIVTRTDSETPPNPALVDIVRRKGGIGFIAERPHGYGLCDGLRAAMKRGMLPSQSTPSLVL